MSTDERPRRPRLERTEPIRNWSQLLRTPASGGGDGAAADGTNGGFGDVVSRSVEIGYRVIDDYVRQGERAARRIREGEYGPERWGQDAQDLGQRMLQHASELAATWLQLLDRSTRTRPADGHPAAPATARTPEGALASRLRLEVASVAECSVALEVDLEGARRRLAAHALRAADPAKPRIDAIEIEPGSEQRAAVLRITVPPHHPAGTYEGLVMDADTSRPVGVVRVVVGEPASK